MAVTSRRSGGWLEVSFTTAAAPDQVYEFLADLRRHSEWAGTLATVTQTSEGPPVIGATYRSMERMREGSEGEEATYAELTALEPPRRIGWAARTEAPGGPMAMRSRWEFLIEPHGAGSHVTQRMRFDPPNLMSRVFLAVFLPVADLMGGVGASSRMVKKNMARLEEKLAALAAAGTA